MLSDHKFWNEERTALLDGIDKSSIKTKSPYEFVDEIKGKNIIQSTGAIHLFTKENIANHKKNSESNLDTNLITKENLISVLIGGENKHYRFSEKNILDLIKKVKELKKKIH